MSCLLAKQPPYQKRTDQEFPASPGEYKRQQRARRKPGRSVGSDRLNGKRRQTKRQRAQRERPLLCRKRGMEGTKTLWDQPGGGVFSQSQKESTKAFTWKVTRGHLTAAVPRALSLQAASGSWGRRHAAPRTRSGSGCRSQSRLFPLRSSTMTYLRPSRSKTCPSEQAGSGPRSHASPLDSAGHPHRYSPRQLTPVRAAVPKPSPTRCW